MSVAAILGAGPLGSAIAHKLAERAAFRRVLLIDEAEAAATGLALDIRQSGPIGGFDVDLSASGDALSATGADVVILADPLGGGDWEGDRGLALIGRLARAGANAPFVLAGPKHVALMERAAAELRIPADRLIGSGASGLVSAVRALVGIELDLAGAAVNVAIAGRPPAFVVGWSSATVAGALVTERIPAHRLAAIGQAMPKMWPPGPQVSAAATALVADALVHGSRQLHYAMTVLDGDLGGTRGVAAMLPLELGRGRILRRARPSFSPLEENALLTGITRA